MQNTQPLSLPQIQSRPAIETAPVLDVPLALTDYERTLDWIDAAVDADHSGYICVAAVHTVMACQEDPELRDAVVGRRLHGAGRPAARLGAQRARPRPA